MKKPLKEITRVDIDAYYDSINVNNTTRANYTINLRKFFKWLYQDENSDCIKGIKSGKVKQNKLKYSDLLTEDDIKKLIDVCPNPQHRAFIAVLYDTACRISEIIGLNRENVVCNNGVWSISVDGKTGIRNIPLGLSTVYLEPWFNQYHPTKNNVKSPLFVSMSPRDLYNKIEDRHLSVNGAWYIIDPATRALGINKEVHPHLFRHSRLNWLSDHGMPENMMRLYTGWTPGSNMPAVYLHTNPISVANKIREIQGGEQAPKPEPSKLLPKECPRCKTMNDVSSKYCRKCWLPLNIKVSIAETLMIDLFRSSIYKEESQIAKEERRYLDLDHLAGKLKERKEESVNPRQKQVQFVRTSTQSLYWFKLVLRGCL